MPLWGFMGMSLLVAKEGELPLATSTFMGEALQDFAPEILMTKQ